MKKGLYILVSIVGILGILFAIFPPKKIATSCGMIPCEYVSKCKGVYLETHNDQAFDSNAGGVCFGRVEQNKNEFYTNFLRESKGVTENTSIRFNVYYNNNTHDPNLIRCEKVYPVSREVPYTKAVATAALQALIKGPTQEESKNGYLSSIPVDSTVNSLSIKNMTAYVDVDDTFFQVGGSCGTISAANALTKTLLQFPTVQDIEVTVNNIPLSEYGQGLI